MDLYGMPPYNTYGMPINPNGGPVSFSGATNQQSTQQAMIQQQQQLATLETPKIVADSKPFFSVIKEGESSSNSLIPVDREIPDVEKKRGRPRKESGSSTSIVRAGNDDKPKALTGTVEDSPTAYTYMETNNLLHETLGQIDMVNGALMQEFNLIKNNRTMKNKYMVLNNLAENIGANINNRLTVIKELNNTISKSNDLDYKRAKDAKAAAAIVDDDKYIADLYKSFIQNPVNVPPSPQMPNVDPSIFGSGIVRADLHSGDYNSNGPVDAGYLNYVSNLTPEQNMMRYEDNPNVKQVVVYDASTGNRFFQVMDMSTGQVIPNVPVYDQMFMDDTTIDIKNKTAKNINLNETFPLVVINEGVTANY